MFLLGITAMLRDCCRKWHRLRRVSCGEGDKILFFTVMSWVEFGVLVNCRDKPADALPWAGGGSNDQARARLYSS
jgi:hypothetical protein